MLTELNSYISQHPPPPDAPSVRCTFQYLSACNLLFEQGLLSHNRVFAKDMKVLHNVKQGYTFFADWLQTLIDEGTL